MPFALDPDPQLGPWVFYIIFACTIHTGLQATLALVGVIFQRIQRPVLTLGTSIAMCSGAGFLVSLAWGNDVELEHAVVIAWRLILAAAAAGPVLFLWSMSRWPAMHAEMGMPTWVALTNLGGCSVFLIVLLLNVVGPIPGAEMVLGILMLAGLALYWSPVFLLPWKLLTKMDPTSFVAGIL